MEQDERFNYVGGDMLRSRLASGVLLAQGPMGTALITEAGVDDIPAAFWNVAEPQTVARIHMMHGLAGADLMITNTFQASSPVLERDGIKQAMATVNRAAVDCANQAHVRLVAGSIGPCGLEWFLEDSPEYREIRSAYREQAEALLAAGACGILLETFTSIRDADPAIRGVQDAAAGMPILVSYAVSDEGALLGDGLNIEAAAVYAAEHGVDAVGVNCCSLGPAAALVERMVRAVSIPVMVRPNAGAPYRDDDGIPRWQEDPEAFAAACVAWRSAGAALVGACCGATPRSTCAMAAALDKFDVA